MDLPCALFARSTIPSISKILYRHVTRYLYLYVLHNRRGSFISLEESLLVVRSLGIQTSSISPYYLFPPTTRFIPTSQIRDLFIHEAFRGFEVRYYLAVVVDGEPEVVVVFPVSFISPLFPVGFDRRSKKFVSVIELYDEPK